MRYTYMTRCTNDDCLRKKECYRQTKPRTLTDSNFNYVNTTEEECASFIADPQQENTWHVIN